MQKIRLNWTDFKSNVDSMGLDVQYFIRGERYFIHAFNGPFHFSHEMDSDGPNFTDFDTNYRPAKLKRLVEQTVKISEEKYNADTAGIYQAHGYEFLVPATVGWHGKDITFDFNISLFSATCFVTPECDGDLVEFYIAPDTTTGAITQDVVIGDTIIHVSQTVIDNIENGYYIRLTDGTTTEASAIKVLDFDKNALTITRKIAATEAYLAATPTYCQMTIKMVDDIPLVGGTMVELGKDTVGGSYVPKNTVLQMKYQNKDGVAKRFVWTMEYKY